MLTVTGPLGERQRRREPRRLGDQPAIGVERERGAIEHQLVLAADEVEVDQRQAGFRHPCHGKLHPVVLLAGLEGRRIDDDQELGTAFLEPLGNVGKPHVLADHGPETDSATILEVEPHRSGNRPRGKHPLLVEHPVIRQLVLRPPPLDHTVGQQEDAIARALSGLRPGSAKQDGGRPRRRVRRQRIDQRRRALQQRRLEHQILERVAGERKLGKHDEIRASRTGVGMKPPDQRQIAVEVTDGGIALC